MPQLLLKTFGSFADERPRSAPDGTLYRCTRRIKTYSMSWSLVLCYSNSYHASLLTVANIDIRFTYRAFKKAIYYPGLQDPMQATAISPSALSSTSISTSQTGLRCFPARIRTSPFTASVSPSHLLRYAHPPQPIILSESSPATLLCQLRL